MLQIKALVITVEKYFFQVIRQKNRPMWLITGFESSFKLLFGIVNYFTHSNSPYHCFIHYMHKLDWDMYE